MVLTRASICIVAMLGASDFASAAPASHPPMRPLPTPLDREPARSGARFVDSSGDDASDGSALRPWRTIGFAVQQLRPGDTLYIGGGTYYETITLDLRGTAAAPITIRASPNELVILDAGLREFTQTPASAWEPVKGGAPGEYRSTRSYPTTAEASVRGTGVIGYFADSMVPLHSYRLYEDLQSKNEYWNLPDNASPAHGIYVGPGIWLDKGSARFHVRLAHTTLAGQVNYRGETDPRKLPLVVGAGDRVPLRIEDARHLRVQDLVVRGGGAHAVHVARSEHVELDRLTIYGGWPALYVQATSHFRLIRSALRGLAAPWSSRASMKYRGMPSFLMIADGSSPQSREWEIAYNEFTDNHDGLILATVKGLRFHHNLVENLNDDGIFLNERDRTFLPSDVHIYENVFSRILTTLAFAEDRKPGNAIGAGAYVYRNVFDLREGTYNMPPRAAGTGPAISFSRTCGDHGSPTWEPLFIYHNTIVTDTTAYRGYYGSQLVMGMKGTRRRILNNIFVQLSGSPGLSFEQPEADLHVDGNIMWSASNPALTTAAFFALFRRSPIFANSKRTYAPGWGASDLYADPKLVELGDRLDARLRADSPARDRGVSIPRRWPDSLRKLDRGAPDVGALPLGAPALRVGPGAAPTPR